METTLSLLALLIACLALVRSLKFSPYQRHEYQFFLDEYEVKTGRLPKLAQRLRSWWAASGGPAPAWHWIGEVISPKDSFK